MAIRRIVVAGLGLVLVAGCSSSSTSSPTSTGPTSGMVTGVLQLGSAVAGGSPQRVSGTITLKSAEGKTTTTPAGSDGTFSVSVPAGAYTVTGRTPMFIINGTEGTCVNESTGGQAPLDVAAGQTVSVTVVCPTK